MELKDLPVGFDLSTLVLINGPNKIVFVDFTTGYASVAIYYDLGTE